MKILILKICLWSLLCCQSLADLPGWENVRINMNNIGPTVYGANSITHAIVTNIPDDYHDFYYIWHVNEDIFSFQVYHAYNETKYIYQWDSDDIGMNTVHVCLFKGPFTMIKCNSTKVLVNSHLQVNFKVQPTSGSWLQTDIFPLGTVNISCSLIDPSAFFENSTITYNWTTGDGRGYTNASLNASYWTTQHKYITTGLHVLKVNVSTTGPNSAKYYGIATENITIYEPITGMKVEPDKAIADRRTNLTASCNGTGPVYFEWFIIRGDECQFNDPNVTRITTLSQDQCFSVLEYTFNSSGVYCVNVTAVNFGGSYLKKSILHISGTVSPAITATIAAAIILIFISLLLLYIMYAQTTTRKRRVEVASFDYLLPPPQDERSTFKKLTDWFKSRDQNDNNRLPLLIDTGDNYGSITPNRLDNNVYEL